MPTHTFLPPSSGSVMNPCLWEGRVDVCCHMPAASALQGHSWLGCGGVQVAFLEGPLVAAVTGDARGRLVHHNVSAYLSLAAMLAGRLSKAGQPTVLTDGRQLGPVCALAGLPAGKTDAGMHMLESMLIMCSAKGCYVGPFRSPPCTSSLHGMSSLLHIL